jgi:phosphopantothenoylcysteine synthetase/decarboxylase
MTGIRRPTRKRREVTPPTQVVRPPFFVNENVIYPPLAQQVPTKERMLGGNVTSAELKHVLEANAKALRHGGKPTTLGYGTDWATIQERAAEKIRTKRSTLDGDNRTATNRRHQLWQDEADKIWKNEPDLTKQQVAERIVELESDPDETGTVNWIKRHIVKK